ncbi:Hypothetical protein CUL131002_1495c [Corynebacterium ulcerans]|nr:Hypothetical protein CUL131002_1495c [Corynebacterium ulcerans]
MPDFMRYSNRLQGTDPAITGEPPEEKRNADTKRKPPVAVVF